MYAFLLILGAVIAAAGVVLIGPGLPFGGRDYDASIVTPGAVAIVGGLILIGLALAVRARRAAVASSGSSGGSRRSGHRRARCRGTSPHPIPAQAGR
jgi:hypothetical protein